MIQLPPAFARYHQIGGTLAFAAFSDVDGDENSAASAIGNVIPDANQAKLRSLGARSISDRAFFGDWYDEQSGDLLRLGTITTHDGRTLSNPRLRDLDGVAVSSAGNPLPEPGAGGQFAYAFSWTPYGLEASPAEVQSLFSAVKAVILPAGLEHEILDWSSPRLVEVSPYFRAGMEWWGVFLFTIYTPSTRRLFVIAGSTTD